MGTIKIGTLPGRPKRAMIIIAYFDINFSLCYINIDSINMKYLLFSLFIFGLILAVIGWFFEKAFRLTWLMKKFFPDQLNGINTLDFLASNVKHGITSENPGFNVILERWPQSGDKDSVRYIGRGPAYIKFGSRVENDFALVMYDEKKNKIEPVWTESSAKHVLLEEIEKRLFWIGKCIFFGGILMSFVSGLLEFLKRE